MLRATVLGTRPTSYFFGGLITSVLAPPISVSKEQPLQNPIQSCLFLQLNAQGRYRAPPMAHTPRILRLDSCLRLLVPLCHLASSLHPCVHPGCPTPSAQLCHEPGLDLSEPSRVKCEPVMGDFLCCSSVPPGATLPSLARQRSSFKSLSCPRPLARTVPSSWEP